MKKHYIDKEFNRLCGSKGDYAITKSDVTCEKCLDKLGIGRDGSILTPIKCNFCNRKLSLNQIFENENAVDLHCCHCGIAMVIDGFQDEQISLLKKYVKVTEYRLDNM